MSGHGQRRMLETHARPLVEKHVHDGAAYEERRDIVRGYACSAWPKEHSPAHPDFRFGKRLHARLTRHIN